jgi:hypothetical protein
MGEVQGGRRCVEAWHERSAEKAALRRGMAWEKCREGGTASRHGMGEVQGRRRCVEACYAAASRRRRCRARRCYFSPTR